MPRVCLNKDCSTALPKAASDLDASTKKHCLVKIWLEFQVAEMDTLNTEAAEAVQDIVEQALI